MLLEIENLVKTYLTGSQTVRAVDGVSLCVDAGEFVAVQGPSGCGKTTLLLVAGALLAPDSGLVRIAGKNPYELPADRRARFRAKHVGFVFQQFHLVPYLSVMENVLAPSLAADPQSSNESALCARAAELIAEFGLESRKHHVPGQLSTGERQRTALARRCSTARRYCSRMSRRAISIRKTRPSCWGIFRGSPRTAEPC